MAYLPHNLNALLSVPRSPWTIALIIAIVIVTGCGRSAALTPITPPKPAQAAQAPEPTPLPAGTFWVKNHKLTELWNGPAGQAGVRSLGLTSRQFCSFLVLHPQDNARLYALNVRTNDHVWIDADAVGPAPPPEQRTGTPPTDQGNCTDVIYAQQVAATPQTPQARTQPPIAQDIHRDQHLVLALYYPWFDMATWTRGITADTPQVPYASSDRATIERQVDQARSAGIDALVSAWYGPRDNNPTETNFTTLLDVAQAKGLRAGLLLETDSNEWFPDRPSMVRALQHFLAVHATHPAYLRVEGRPVILVWHPYTAFGADGRRVNQKSQAAVAAWRSLIGEVDPQHRVLWIAEGDYFDLLAVFDGIFPYSIAWSPDPAAQLQQYGQRTRSFAAQAGAPKLWVATAMPGYDDTKIVGRAHTFAVARQDGAYYQKTFQGAIASKPDWIVITSFNEWPEGHQIEPSAGYGSRYLDLTRALAAQFKGETAASRR